MKTQSYVEFECPKCHGSTFGSSRNPDGTWERMCHGTRRSTVETGCAQHPVVEALQPCGFQWQEADDWQHFRLVTKFASREEFAPVLEASLNPVGGVSVGATVRQR